MSLRLRKIEVEFWTKELWERFVSGELSSDEEENLKVWCLSELLPEFYNETLNNTLAKLCSRNGFLIWRDFNLIYEDGIGVERWVITYDTQGKLIDVRIQNGYAESIRLKLHIDMSSAIRNMLTLPIIVT